LTPSPDHRALVTAATPLDEIDLERSALENRLRESEQMYRLLLDGVQDYAIFMMDPQGTILSWSIPAERIKGYSAEEIIGQNFSRFFPLDPTAGNRPAEVLRLAAESGRHEEEGLRVRRDGSQFLADVTITALRDHLGHLRGYVEVSHDLSESKEAAAQYRGLLEAAPDAMVVVNAAGTIVLLNVQAEKRFGYHRDELLGQPVTNIIPKGFAERLVADGLRSAADALAQQIGTGIELSGLRKDGSFFPLELMLSPLESPSGVLVTAAIRDITARKRAEEHLFKTLEELKRSNDELERFAYLASHDLQEPLRMVASFTELLAKRYKGRLDADADEYIAFAVDGSNRMQKLIQDLLLYSRAGGGDHALEDVSSEMALSNALHNLEGAITESGAVVTHDELPVIKTDAFQLTQVFQNLIGNAVKYRSASVPQIRLGVTKDAAAGWIFSVRDNGIGIDPKYFEKIFVLFQRLHGRDDYSGTGIGLAICKKILQRLGGRMWLESQPGLGSTFYFSLPAGDRS
jgi:PAS domain S-box-containing protein